MDRKTLLFMSCAAATVFLMSCGSPYRESAMPNAAPTQEPVTFNVATERQDTRITVDAGADQALVQVFSPSGIGGAGAEVTSTALPRKIVLRFHLRGLEELRFTYGDTVITAAVSSAGGNAIRQSYRGGQSGAQEQSIAEASPYWMPIRIVPDGGASATPPPQAGYIEVEAPADFIARGQRKFSIHWIDFYR